MKKLTAGFLSALLLASLFSGCSRKNRTDTIPLYENKTVMAATETKTDEEMCRNYSEFVFDIAGRCAKESDGNVLISADSILFSLGMTAAGASGDTLTQMTDVLVPGADPADAVAFCIRHYNELQNDSISIGNSVWINKAMSDTLKDAYVVFTRENFDARVENIEFDTQGIDTINSWVSEKTRERIPHIIQPEDIDPNTYAVLVNAIAFDGVWKEGFERVDEDYFFNADGSKVSADFLYGTADTYISSSDAEGFIRPYDGDRFALMVILPDDPEISASDYLAKMSSDSYWDLWESRKNVDDLRIMLPEFTNEYDIELSSILIDMGMKDAFAAADFSNMTDSSVRIDKVIHKTYINVNEEGTTAAAATATVMLRYGGKAMSPSVTCNRPFVYAIVDLDTGLPVFLGTLDNIK